MGCWGMGITQSDEYCEIYERFMEEYDEGKPLLDIKQDILDEYLEEFDENDGVLHDMYFAIGKAEWMCGGISDEILEKIAEIINSGSNIEFLRELEATESDLKIRKKNLDKFLSALMIPRGKTKKRKIPTEKYIKVEKPKLPSFKCGDVFAYEIDGKYRLICFISRQKFFATYASYSWIWTKLYETLPSITDLPDEPVMPLGYFTIENFPSTDNLKYCGNIPDFVKLDNAILFMKWKPASYAIAKEENLSEDIPEELGETFNNCLNKLRELRPWKNI